MFWGTRATNFSIYTTKMEGSGPKILGTGAKFKQVPCQKNCRVNRAIDHAFLTYKRRLVYPDLNFILDLFTCMNWANICVDLPTEVSQLFSYYVCRFLVLVGHHDSDWGFSFISQSGI